MIILIHGKAGAGKSTLANLIVNKLLWSGVKDVFIRPQANAVKSLALLLGWDGRKSDKGRRFLQEIAQAVRNWDSSTWARMMLTSCEPDTVSIVDDWRFDDEYSYLLLNSRRKVYTVLIDGRQRELSEECARDVSERGLELVKEFDAYVDNSYGLMNLEFHAKQIAGAIDAVLNPTRRKS